MCSFACSSVCEVKAISSWKVWKNMLLMPSAITSLDCLRYACGNRTPIFVNRMHSGEFMLCFLLFALDYGAVVDAVCQE